MKKDETYKGLEKLFEGQPNTAEGHTKVERVREATRGDTPVRKNGMIRI